MRKLRNPIIDGHKKCGVCYTVKPVDEFSMKKSLHGEMFHRSKCKQCVRDYTTKRNRSLGVQPNKWYPIIDGHKQCTRCNHVKPVDQFRKMTRNMSGIRAHCIECDLEKSLEYRRAKGMVPKTFVAHPIIDGLKQCYLCNENLSVEKFSLNSRGHMLHSCKACNREKEKPYRHKYRKRDHEEITDGYVAAIIRRNTKVQKKDIPQELLDMYRTRIKLKRELKQLKQLV